MMRLVLIALLLLAPSAAHAFTCNASGCSFDAKYTEPSTNTLGAPLTNLTSCTVNYSISKNGAPAVAAPGVVVPASRPTGGTAMTKTITDVTLVPGNNYTVTGAYACSNAAGTGPSTPSTAPLPIQRAGEVPPAGGSGLTLE